MNVLFSALSVAAIALAGLAFSLSDNYGGTDGVFGAISFPTSLDTFTNPSATDSTATVSHSGQHSDANDAIEALQAKVGIDGSAVTTSFDYKLSGVTGSDIAASLTGTETFTNKTLTAPTINNGTFATSTLNNTTLNGTTTIASGGKPVSIDLGSDATGDIYYRNSAGEFERLPIGTAGQFLVVSSGAPLWETTTPELDINIYTATSSGTSVNVKIPTTANDTLVMWAEFDELDAACNTGTGQRVDGSLTYKQNFEGSTTTIVNVADGTAAGGSGCNAVAIGTFTATTTGTTTVAAVISLGDYVSLIVQHFIQ